MAESNFVDYVKIYCRSGKGGRGSTHMRRRIRPMAAPTEVTEDEEVTLSYVVTVTTGRCCICATTAMHWPDMENPVPRTAVLVRMEKIRLLKFPYYFKKNPPTPRIYQHPYLLERLAEECQTSVFAYQHCRSHSDEYCISAIIRSGNSCKQGQF